MIMNNTISEHEPNDFGTGILFPLPKSNKPKSTVKSLRPIILLESSGIILSKILLNRIQPIANTYLSKSQRGYRIDRSMADIAWSYRWILVNIPEQDLTVYSVGVDTSSTFDTICRDKLIEINEEFLHEGEMRILRVLLSHTDLEMKIRGAVTKPQGDGVSGPFFAIYFEHYLKKLCEEVKNIPINIYNINSQQSEKRQPNLPNESLYVDDYDFITEDEKTKSMVI